MQLKQVISRTLSGFLLPFVLCFLIQKTSIVYAAGASIQATPGQGSFAKQFAVSLTIDGKGEKFNAAQADIHLSSNLAIQNLTTGDCNFSFLQTPSIENPSFSGVLLGDSLTKCTVYTMTVIPIQKGDASITIQKGNIKRFGDAANIFSSPQNGNYTLTGVVKASSQPTISQPKGNLYSVLFTITNTNNTVVPSTTVFFKSVVSHIPLQGVTDKNGRVQFPNIPSGIYDLLVSNYPDDHIVNITGNNHTLALGITVGNKKKESQNSQSTLLFIFCIAGAFLVGGAIVAGIMYWKFKK